MAVLEVQMPCKGLGDRPSNIAVKKLQLSLSFIAEICLLDLILFVSSYVFNPESGYVYMCAVSHFGTKFGILCAATRIMPAGHGKTTQIKCEIERRRDLKLASSGDAVWHMRVAAYCKKNPFYFPNKHAVLSAVQAAGGAGGPVGAQWRWLGSVQGSTWPCYTLTVILLSSSCRAALVGVLLCPPPSFCNHIYFTQARGFPLPFYICCFASCRENSRA